MWNSSEIVRSLVVALVVVFVEEGRVSSSYCDFR
jgi:hypothetical protein